MRAEDADIERIEAFVEGRMSDAERHAFEERLGTDSALVDEVHAYRVTRKALAQVFAEQQQGKAHNDNVVRPPLTPKRTWVWAAAASVALLLGVGSWYFLGSKTSLPELAECYAVHESPLPVLMSAPQDHHSELDKSMQLFGADRYDQALAELDLLPTSDTVAFYAGLCELGIGQDPSARFQPVIDNDKSMYQAKALYHLMLWHLEQGRRSDAVKLLNEQLRMIDHPYHQQLEALASSNALLP